MTFGLAVAVFLALTMSVNLWLATSLHNPAIPSTVAKPNPTPDPHP